MIECNNCSAMNNGGHGLHIGSGTKAEITGIISRGNGGDGLHIGSGVQADITGFISHGNGGRGAYIANDAKVNMTDFSSTENSGGGIVIGEIQRLAGVSVPQEMQHAAEKAIDEVKLASSQKDAEDKLERSGLGRWLRQQRGVEWLGVIATIAAAFWAKR